MLMPLASAHAHLPADQDRATAMRCRHYEITVDDPSQPDGVATGPTPLELMTGSLAACTAMTARSFLERDGDPGDVEVSVTLDAGPPTLLYRRVMLGRRLDPDEEQRLAGALERTEVTMMLRPGFSIRTSIEVS